MHHTTRGILWMITSCVLAAVLVSLVRVSTRTLHPFEVAFFRNCFALPFFLPWLIRKGVWQSLAHLKTDQLRWHFARALCGAVGMLSWFYALANVPLPMATALSFTSPLFTAILAALLLKEHYSVDRWVTLLIGFAGTLVILRPGTEHFEPVGVIVIFSTVFWAISGIIIKRLTKHDDPVLVSFYLNLLITPLSLPTALMVWQTPGLGEIAWLVLMGLTACLFQISMTRAIAATDFAVILPFDFTRLVFVSLFAWLFFDEVISRWTLAGSVIIMAAAAHTAYADRRQRKLRKLEASEILE